MNIPTLTTERLLLLPPGPEAEQLYRDFYTNPAASIHYGGPLTARAAWERLSCDVGSWHLLGFGVWVIKHRHNDQLLGTCGFWQRDGWPRELTWWLLPEARGSGFATEASLAALNYAYTVLSWSEVQTYMKDTNEAAHALVRRLQGEAIGRQLFPDGEERNVYRLYRERS